MNLEKDDSLRHVIDLLSSFAKRNHGEKWNRPTMHCDNKCFVWHFQNCEQIHMFFAMVTGKRTRSVAKYFPARPDLTLPEKRSRGEYNSLRLNPFRLDMLNDFILLFPYAKWLYSCSVKSVMFSWYAEYANDNYE